MTDWLVPLTDVRFTEDDVAAVADVYRAGWLSQGPRVAEFERAFAALTGVPQAVAVASGTAALHLGLILLGVTAGDEVVLPSLTFAATAATVVSLGARPVFADIAGPQAPWLSAASVEAVLTPRCRAIVNVAYGGAAGDAIALAALARERGIGLLEDAAHAVGATVDGRAVGTIGDIGAFSFFANKNVPLGEGGMLVAADPRHLQRARRLRAHGLTSGTWERHGQSAPAYEVAEPGFNYRLDEPRAALGTRLLGRLPDDRARRRSVAAGYARALSDFPMAAPVIAGARAEGCGWYIYPVTVPAAADRDRVRDRLARFGVQTSVHYPPLHRSPAFGAFATGALPATESYAARTLTLPLYGHMTAGQRQRVLSALVADVD